MNQLEKIVERTREDVARRAKQVAYAELERLAAGAASRAASTRRCCAPAWP